MKTRLLCSCLLLVFRCIKNLYCFFLNFLQTLTFLENMSDYWTVTFLERENFQYKKSATPSHLLLSKFLMVVVLLRSTGWYTRPIIHMSSQKWTHQAVVVRSKWHALESRVKSLDQNMVSPMESFEFVMQFPVRWVKFGALFVIRFLTIPYSTFLKTGKLYLNKNALLIPFNNGFALKFRIYWKPYNKKMAFWGGYVRQTWCFEHKLKVKQNFAVRENTWLKRSPNSLIVDESISSNQCLLLQVQISW